MILIAAAMIGDPLPVMDDRSVAAPRELIAVLDMGASADPPRRRRNRRRPSRSGPSRKRRAACCSAATRSRPASIRSHTIDAALSALDGFPPDHGRLRRQHVRAVATSAVREARNGDMFLDRIQRTHRHRVRDHQRSRREPAGVPRGASSARRRHAALRGAWTLLAEVGGGSTSLTLLRRDSRTVPASTRSAPSGCGSSSILRRLATTCSSSLLKRSIANVIEEIRLEIPLDRVTLHRGDRRRRALRGLADSRAATADEGVREIPRDAFLAFCDEIERIDEDS